MITRTHGHARSAAEELPLWDLTVLFGSTDSVEIDNEFTFAREQSARFVERFSGIVLGALTVAEAMPEYERCVRPLQLITAYAELLMTINGNNSAAAALLARCDEAWGELGARIGFFERGIVEMDDDEAAKLAQDDAFASYQNFAAKVRELTAMQASAEVEAAMSQLSATGVDGWQRMSTQLLARIEVAEAGKTTSVGEALPFLHHADRRIRRTYHAAISRALAPEIELRATALGMITKDTAIRATIRGTGDRIAERRAVDQLSAAEVAGMLDAAAGRQYLLHAYYRAKRQLIGYDVLHEYDRYAPVTTTELPPISWSWACSLAYAVYDGISPELGRIARELVAGGCVDAAPRLGKRRTPVTRATVPGMPPFVMVNFTGKLSDVLTLAHELGHGVHMVLAGGQPLVNATPPTVLGETIALLYEALAVRQMVSELADPAQQAVVLGRWLEDQLVSVFHKLSLHRFEDLLHASAARNDVLNAATISGHWMATQTDLYGDSVTLTPEFAGWWSYVDGFFSAPGSQFSYVYGQLAALMLLRRLDEDRAAFVPAYLDLLRAGGSAAPADLLRTVGGDPREPSFWHLGLDLLEGPLVEFLRVAGLQDPVGSPRIPDTPPADPVSSTHWGGGDLS